MAAGPDAPGHSPTPDFGYSWAEIPTALLRQELLRRQSEHDGRPPCGSGSNRAAYNTPLHVFALVLILVLSTLACSFPIIVRRFPRLPVPHQVLFLSRHFGTGVLIATAFVHLLPTAFVSLTDQCLPPFWNEGYPAMPGLIAMLAVLIVVGIEMFFATRGAGHIHGSEYDTLVVTPGAGAGEDGHITNGRPRASSFRSDTFKRFRQAPIGGDPDEQAAAGSGIPSIALNSLPGSSENLVAGASPLLSMEAGSSRSGRGGLGSSTELGAEDAAELADRNSDSDLDSDLESDLELSELAPSRKARPRALDLAHGSHRHRPVPKAPATPGTASQQPLTAAQQRKMLLQCLLLEAGILFHSVFIGMALSVSTGTPFIILLVAISFHQTFEGLALGSRIAALSFPAASPRPWLMALAYGTTTPVGQAIGLGIHNLYDPASQTGLLTVGVMNAISSGLLLFAGLVELLAEDFLSDASYESLRGRRRIEACASVVAGAGLMALVGAWA
ncbi:Zinc/iron permease [Lineolata rhizophorae]|uniref:Zinc/iron permease n=1 Tax=Lineolata rhizophorae TaxID=578093 RepID=A0A6A6NM16_9PEZI|nr:Zinc/iron permease [Lineolata rhizophorae]